MDAAKPATLGIFKDCRTLEAALNRLRDAGFTPEEISVIAPPHADDAPVSIEGAEIGAGTGALFGGIMGWLIGAGTLAIPGLGALIIAGPIGTAIAGSAVMGGVGGIFGSFVG